MTLNLNPFSFQASPRVGGLNRSANKVTLYQPFGTICVGFIVLALVPSLPPNRHTVWTRASELLSDIANAVHGYQLEYGDEPPMHTAQFYSSLRGSNPRGVRFMSRIRKQENDVGAMHDIWGSPYQVFFGTDGWLIQIFRALIVNLMTLTGPLQMNHRFYSGNRKKTAEQPVSGNRR